MSADWDSSPWSCAGPVGVKASKPKKAERPVEEKRDGASYVLPPLKRKSKDVGKRLKPEKWRGVFDAEGRPVGFQKLLKAIAHGGVDPSIRAEVWEFLLGCYAIGTTAEYRQELRELRRERYRKLIEQCQQMHASIGTGTLAYTVGSKVMDVRIMSKDTARKEAKRVHLEPKTKLEDTSREEEITQTPLHGKVAASQLDTSTDFECSFRNVSMGYDSVYKSSKQDQCPENDVVVEAIVDCVEESFKSPPGTPLYFEDADDLFESGMNTPTLVDATDELEEANSGMNTPTLLDAREESEEANSELEEANSGMHTPTLREKLEEANSGMHTPTLREKLEEANSRMNTPTLREKLEEANSGMNTPTLREKLEEANSRFLAGFDTGIRDLQGESNPKPVESSKPKRLFSTEAGPLSWSAGSLKRIKSRLVREKRKKDRGTESPFAEGTRTPEHRLMSEHRHGPEHRRSATEGRLGLQGASVSVDLHEPVVALGKNASEERVAEWLWILHRIVVDVVRTDRHLEFYGDSKNMARMSDILAVYAWIDPETGYCQGMSDLLSPFIVLFEDDADAFWCFESLVRRVRQNFQMEGPVGVMKQLQALSKILEVTDPQMSKHFAVVGADNFLFAFRMLLVLFRRELPFADSLLMWEMMWAADFNQAMAWSLDFHCVDALVLRLPASLFQMDVGRTEDISCSAPSSMIFAPAGGESSPLRDYSLDTTNAVPNSSHFGANFLGRTPFCGLRPASLFMKQQNRMLPSVSTFLGKNGDEELSVFCVAAILVQNRSKLLREVQSLDDAIKIFNDMNFVIRVHSCVQTASKLRKKYRSRLAKHIILGRWSSMTY